jgi:hypothetical protein
MVMQGRGLRRRWGALRSSRGTFHPLSLGFLHDHICSVLVGWVVQQAADVVHKQWVQKVSDLLLVGKFQRSLKWNPD